MKWILVVLIAYKGDGHFSYDQTHAMPDKETCYEALEKVLHELSIPDTDRRRHGGVFAAYCATDKPSHE